MRFTKIHLLLVCSALIPACAIPGDAPWSDLHVNAYAAGFTPTLEASSNNIVVLADNGVTTGLKGAFTVDAEKEYTRQYGARIGFAPFEVAVSQFSYSRNQNGIINGGTNGSFGGEVLNGDLAVDSTFDIDATKVMIGIDMINTSAARVGFLAGLDVLSFNEFSFTSQETKDNILAGQRQNVLVNQEIAVPVIGLRGDIAIPGTDIRLGAEITGVSIDVEGAKTSFFDHDINLNMAIFEHAEAVIGYRAVNLNIDGEIEGTTTNMDLSMSGPYFGVSVYF